MFLSLYPDHTDDYEPESFRELENWIEMIKETEAARNRVVPRILVGNKVDLTEGIVVDVSTARVSISGFFSLCSNDQNFVRMTRNGQNRIGCGLLEHQPRHVSTLRSPY